MKTTNRNVTLVGEDDMRAWLIDQGFRCAEDNLRARENQCNWYAYRRSELEARRCECNDDKPGMQLIVKPSVVAINGTTHRGVEVELCGEAGGLWWNFSSYGMRPEEFQGKLAEVERGLIVAWNAIRPSTADGGEE